MYPVHTGANPDFVCIIKKKKKKRKAIVMVRRGGEGDVVQKVPSGIALSAVIGKYSKRYGCEHRTLTLQCQWCKNWSTVCIFM